MILPGGGYMHKNLHNITMDKLQKIYTMVGDRKGWDFSQMKTEKEPPPWDYMELVLRYIKQTDYILDIGTGGGERFFRLSKHFSKGVGIDMDSDMISTAEENANKKNINTVMFQRMEAEHIQFPKNTFDIVLNRHAPIVPGEIAKVLKRDGYCITQQVEKENMKNLKKIFHYEKTWKNNVHALGQDFEKHGCRIIATGKYNINYWVKDIPSLVFWLKAVDLPENFTVKNHGLQLLRYIKEYITPKGFITNESREFLVVRKK